MRRTKSFTDNLPLLYLVATPIGNLKEMSPRAIEVLSETDFIACEDTRNTHSLLERLNIKSNNLFSLREHNEVEASNKVISLLESGKKVVYVSDAGYPGISDPGKILAKKVREKGYAVSTINGSNALLNALTASSLDSEHFYFHGFLNPVANKAKKELEELIDRKETLIFYEAPHRIKKTLEIMFECLGDRKATVARELTKLNEEFIEGTLSELKDIDENTLIGEFVIVIEGSKNEVHYSQVALNERIEYLLKKNISKKDIADIISYEFNVSKNDIYKMLIEK